MDFWKEMSFKADKDKREPITVNNLVRKNTPDIVDKNKVIFTKCDKLRLIIYWPGYEVFQEDIDVGPPEGWSGHVTQERHMNRVISLGRLMTSAGSSLGKFLELIPTVPPKFGPPEILTPACDSAAESTSHPHQPHL
ncbi:hypothetical protein BD413DRAFT_490755 [Trametes elegans]|nr:hypothetical protein BD413DRAFT_490755 [Trametes elegans]